MELLFKVNLYLNKTRKILKNNYFRAIFDIMFRQFLPKSRNNVAPVAPSGLERRI